MNNLSEIDVEIILGGDLTLIKPRKPYSPLVLNFLNAVSDSIRNQNLNGVYSDLASFGFWCRKANLSRLSKTHISLTNRIGRGIAFHIPPANVPINFAFSLAFGLLAGNANIIRISSYSNPQTKILCELIAKLLSEDKFKEIKNLIHIINYPKNDFVTTQLSKISNARIIWGGDSTIQYMRGIYKKPRCIDLEFSDRFSFCIIDSKSLLDIKPNQLKLLAERFIKDSFIYDQNACSSPHLIYWFGDMDISKMAMNIFWKEVYKIYKKNNEMKSIHAIEKYTKLCLISSQLGGNFDVSKHQNLIYRILLKKIPKDLENFRFKYGFFYEFISKELNPIKEIINDKYQTMTYFGMNSNNLREYIFNNGVKGIDRIVPIGRALEINPIWDGQDTILSLTRIISTF